MLLRFLFKMCNYFLRGNNANKKTMTLLVSCHIAVKSIKENLKLLIAYEFFYGLVNQKTLLTLRPFNDA